ncbi:hypothetical protein OIU34_19415 [Pararhizobium sp. BT-229]|uniref:hypothetical protein n=1 Tax=Pararhizobium sp. BT-229 TaxID=2986923 RepID=UPI0021F71A13|nr:hypothetical protein [Pararhizobium sp. BT-229]MCV9964053.1 hypothetical protein [Pararhizobium sp. BT-229]
MEDRKELEVQAEINVFTDEAHVRKLLWHCVGRLALRDQNRPTAIEFRRDRRKIMHITDWLTAEVARGARWLERLDENGVPSRAAATGGRRDMHALLHENPRKA